MVYADESSRPVISRGVEFPGLDLSTTGVRPAKIRIFEWNVSAVELQLPESLGSGLVARFVHLTLCAPVISSTIEVAILRKNHETEGTQSERDSGATKWSNVLVGFKELKRNVGRIVELSSTAELLIKVHLALAQSPHGF
ncbi:hypothetical protein ANTPLA_LOCUS7253 [Anthophora plagiata]